MNFDVVTIYKHGENEFLDSETILTSHIYDENLKIPIVKPKIKVVESVWCDLSKLMRGESQWKEIQLNRAYQFREKAQKLPENAAFSEYGIFG